MPTSWSDAIEKAPTAGVSFRASRTSTYVPPHLRNKPSSAEPPSASVSFAGATYGNDPHGQGVPSTGGGFHPISARKDRNGGAGNMGHGSSSGGWNNRGGCWDRGREREASPFQKDAAVEPAFREQESTGINFDAYEDIPVETSGKDVPPPVNTFADIDLGESLNLNIRRCKYVKPSPVQKYAIPVFQ